MFSDSRGNIIKAIGTITCIVGAIFVVGFVLGAWIF